MAMVHAVCRGQPISVGHITLVFDGNYPDQAGRKAWRLRGPAMSVERTAIKQRRPRWFGVQQCALRKAEIILSAQGFERLVNIEGATMKWVNTGHPVHKEEI